jgi:hypothetical protein
MFSGLEFRTQVSINLSVVYCERKRISSIEKYVFTCENIFSWSSGTFKLISEWGNKFGITLSSLELS